MKMTLAYYGPVVPNKNEIFYCVLTKLNYAIFQGIILLQKGCTMYRLPQLNSLYILTEKYSVGK